MQGTKAKIKRTNFALLNREVIKPEYCILCGGCESVCPVNVILIEQMRPKLVGGCISCGSCVDICLRINQRLEQPAVSDDLGTILEVYIGKSAKNDIHKNAQNGGIVTSLLLSALKNNSIDGAFVTIGGKDLSHPLPMLAFTEEEIRSASRSKYTQNPALSKLDSVKSSFRENVAVVGLPCHMETLAQFVKKQYLGTDTSIKYRIGLFCMSSYKPDSFRDIVNRELGLDFKNITKTDCGRGKFFFETKDGIKEAKINLFHAGKPEGCKYCNDFSAEFADISVGNVGVDDDMNIIIIRTEAGKELFQNVLESNYLNVEKIEQPKWSEALMLANKLSSSKKKNAKPLPILEI